MNILRRLFGGRNMDFPPMVPTASVHSSPMGIFIAAEHRDVTGWLAPGDPMALLPIDTGPSVIGAALFAALNGWRDGLSKEQSDAQTSQAFKMMDEKDWYGVEKRWNYIFTQLKKDTGMIDITAMDRYETGGYRGSEEWSFECPFEADALGRAVRQVLDGPPPLILPSPDEDDEA